MHHLPSRYIPCDGRLTASAYFLTTLPAGGATIVLPIMRCITLYFNPRSPWGERQAANLRHLILMIISIHAPRGGRHIGLPVTTLRAMAFQSTLPVGGATAHYFSNRRKRQYFNPRSPQGERPNHEFIFPGKSISIHAPRRGSDRPVSARSV